MDTAPELIDLAPSPAIAIRAHVPLAQLQTFFGSAFLELVACAGDAVAGPPLALYHSFDPAEVDVEAVVPVRTPVEVAGRIHPLPLGGGAAIQVRHIGPYTELGEAYHALDQWLVDHSRARADVVREVYLTDPTVPADELVTLVIQPITSEAEAPPPAA